MSRLASSLLRLELIPAVAGDELPVGAKFSEVEVVDDAEDEVDDPVKLSKGEDPLAALDC